MAYEVGEVITLGIGTPSEIGPLIRFGLDAGSGPALVFNADIDSRLLVYLRYYYSTSGSDLTTLLTKYMNAMTTGDRNQRLKKAITDATNAMT